MKSSFQPARLSMGGLRESQPAPHPCVHSTLNYRPAPGALANFRLCASETWILGAAAGSDARKRTSQAMAVTNAIAYDCRYLRFVRGPAWPASGFLTENSEH